MENVTYTQTTRGRPPTVRAANPIQRVQSQHREIIRLKISGFKNCEIAEAVGMTQSHISQVLNSPLVKERIEQIQAAADLQAVDVLTDIKNMAPEAVSLLYDIMKDDDKLRESRLSVTTRMKAASEILDRSGYPKVTQVNNNHAHAHLSYEDMQEIKNRAKALGKKAGVVVDEPIDITPEQ